MYAYIKERIQPAQRFAQERDPYFGVSGMKMNSAMIMKDDYFPSLKYGKNDADLGNYLTGTFTSHSSVGAGSNMPTATSLTVSEVFNWFNTKKWLLRISNSSLFGFGFTGFQASPGQHPCGRPDSCGSESGVRVAASQPTDLRDQRVRSDHD